MSAQELTALLPLIVLAAVPVVLLVLISLYRNHGLTAALSITGFAAAFASIFPASGVVPRQAANLLMMDSYALFFIGLLICAAFLVALLSYGYDKSADGMVEEYYILLLLATLGACVLAASSHLISFFLGLEILSVSLYALIAYTGSPRGEEAGFKYLVLAGVSSAILLFGMALIYAQWGTMEFARLAKFNEGTGGLNAIAASGVIMIIAGAGFKLALAPFHMWTPDVYEGAPAPVSAFIASVSKGAVFALVFRYSLWTDWLAYRQVSIVLTVIAILSMFTGNLLALFQDNIKRVLAYSSIAHLGYMLIALLSRGELAVIAAEYYLAGYFISIIGAFGVVTVLSGKGGEAEGLDDYRGLGRRSPWLSLVFTLMLFSLAGLPLTAGFIGKFYLAAAGVSSALGALVVILAINSAISVFYYLRIVAALYGPAEKEAFPSSQRLTLPAGGALCVTTVLLLWFGVAPSSLIRMIQVTVSSLFPR